MKTKCTLIKQFTQSPICALLSILCYGPLAIGADYLISTQADFDFYKEATFSPGDNILFERGKVFTGMFSPTTVGTLGNMITISTYGSGAKPIINNNGVIHPHPVRGGATVSAAILLFNAEYVEVNNLEVTNNNGGNQSEDLFGIYVLAEDTGKYHNSIYIKDNYVHNINGEVAGKRRGGIHVHGYSPTTSNTATYNDVQIVNNVLDVVGGVGIGTDIDDIDDAHNFVGTSRTNAMTNLYVAHNWIGNTGRNSVIARDSDYAVYEYNTSANSSRYSTGHSFYNFKTLGMTFQYNEAYGNTGAEGDKDRGGFDADYNSKDTVIQYNYSHNNHWFAGIMKKPNTNVTIRYNLSVNEQLGAYYYGFEPREDAENINIYNNTHYFDSSITPEIIAYDRTPLETTFSNNIFYAAGSGSMGSDADDGINVTYDTNVYYHLTPPASEINALTADPLFASPGAEPYDVDMEFGRDILAGYRLSSSSPYLDTGLAISNNGGLDFWGRVVPTGATDIGASEIGENENVPPPPPPFIADFTYMQTDATTGSGTLSATYDVTALGGPADLVMTGDMPEATINQKGSTSPTVPAGMVGFIDDANGTQEGTPLGVHLGWSGTVTLTGTDSNGITYQIEVPLIVPFFEEFTYEFDLTDGGEVGNDAVGNSRVAGWVGDDGSGNRQSGDNLVWTAGVDIITTSKTSTPGTYAPGDALGITVGMRTGDETGGIFTNPGTAVFVDKVTLDGKLLGDLATLTFSTDFNGDFKVDGADLTEWEARYGIDLDGFDFLAWQRQFGLGVGAVAAASSTAVPEPSSIVLIAVGLFGFGYRRRTGA